MEQNLLFISKVFKKYWVPLVVTAFMMLAALLTTSVLRTNEPATTQSSADEGKAIIEESNSDKKKKLNIDVSYNYMLDSLQIVSIRGEYGYLRGENVADSRGDFVTTLYDAQQSIHSQKVFSVLTPENLAHGENIAGESSPFENFTRPSQDELSGLSSPQINNDTSLQSPAQTGLQPGAQGQGNPLLDTVEYEVEIEYDPAISVIQINPSPHSKNTAATAYVLQPQDHRSIQSEIAQSMITSEDVLGAQSGDIGIVFISDNYTKGDIGDFYQRAYSEMDKLYETDIFRRYRSQIDVSYVENYEDLGCEMYWIDYNGSTNLACLEKVCDEETGCRWLNPSRKVREISNEYQSDVVVQVFKTDNRRCRSSAGDGKIQFCSTDSRPNWYILNHELGHALIGLHDEYVNHLTIDPSLNCTSDPTCQVWENYAPRSQISCSQGCTTTELFAPCTHGTCLMSALETPDLGPVTSAIAEEQMRGSFGDPVFTPTTFDIDMFVKCPEGQLADLTNHGVSIVSTLWPPEPFRQSIEEIHYTNPRRFTISTIDQANNVYLSLKDDQNNYMRLHDFNPPHPEITLGTAFGLPERSVAYWHQDLPVSSFALSFTAPARYCN